MTDLSTSSSTVLIVDPPWSFSDSLPGATRGASSNYACMTVDQLCSFELPALSRDAVLFLWRVAAMQGEALRVADAWGFTVKSELVWLKRTATGKRWFGMGRYVRMEHEICLICTRGRAMPVLRNVRSTFEAPALEHSRKPDAFYSIVESLYPDSRKVELFARVVRPGYEQHGDELGSIAPCSAPAPAEVD